MKDYYKILMVSPSATYEEIKRSYRQLAVKYHPDKNLGNSESQNLFVEINQAYKVLSSEKSRKSYDITYKTRISRQMRPVTPQMFLEKFQTIRKFIFTRGKKKISQTALYKALCNLLSDNNIKYLSAKNSVNEQIIAEVLQCCKFLSAEEMNTITNRLLLLAGTNTKQAGSIHAYRKKHKTVKSNKIIEALTTLSYKVKLYLSHS